MAFHLCLLQHCHFSIILLNAYALHVRYNRKYFLSCKLLLIVHTFVQDASLTALRCSDSFLEPDFLNNRDNASPTMVASLPFNNQTASSKLAEHAVSFFRDFARFEIEIWNSLRFRA